MVLQCHQNKKQYTTIQSLLKEKINSLSLKDRFALIRASKKLCLEKQIIKIFDRERTFVDSFRYLDKETALKALQAYLKTNKDRKPELTSF